MATEREVRIKLSAVAAPGAGGDPMQKMAAEARKADVAVKEVSKNWRDVAKNLATAGGSLDGFAKNLAKIKSDNAFQKLSADILRGSKNLDDFNAKMLRAQKIQSQNAGAMSAFQKFQAGGAGGDGASAGGLLGAGGRFGPAGLAVAAGGIMGRDAATLFGLGQAGAKLGDLQKGEGGTILNSYYGLRDTLSGREFRERRDNEALERMQGREARKFASLQSRDRISDAAAEFGRFGETAGVLDPILRLKAQSAQLGDIVGEDARSGLQGRARERGLAADASIDAFRGAKAGSNDQLEALQKARNFTQLALADNLKIVDAMKSQAQLAEQIVTAKKQELQGLKEQFGVLDPAQREEAIRLGAKLKGGEKLSGEEERIAGSLGVLDKQLQKSRLDQVNSDPAFARFLQAAGNEEQQRAAKVALETGKFEVRIELDEEKLLEQLKEEIGPFFKKIEALENNLIGLEGQQQRAQQRRQARQGALVE